MTSVGVSGEEIRKEGHYYQTLSVEKRSGNNDRKQPYDCLRLCHRNYTIATENRLPVSKLTIRCEKYILNFM